MVKDTKVQELIINELTKEQYDQLKDSGLVNDNELYMVTDEDYITPEEMETALEDKQNVLTAGNGIDITNDVISANLDITWGDISGNIVDQSDLEAVLNGKQDTLTAGDGISISNNVISTNGNVVKIVDNEPLLYEDGVVYFIKES